MRWTLIMVTAVALSCCVSPARAAVATSLSNGNWTDPTIWSIGDIPGGDDDVVVLHDINVSATVAECYNLTVGASGQLFNSYGYRSLSVAGDMTVDGAIIEGGWPLTLRLFGDATLNGEVHCAAMEFTGAADHHLWCSSGGLLVTPNATVLGGNLIAMTPLELDATIDFQGHTLVVPEGGSVEFLGGYVHSGMIDAGGRVLRFWPAVELENLTIADPEIHGVCEVAHSVVFTGRCVVVDTLRTSYGNVTVTVDDLVNEGLITNGGWTLDVRVEGDLSNYGTFDPQKLIFGGAGLDHTIQQTAGAVIAPTFLFAETGTGTITVDGDVEIAASVDLMGGSVEIAPGGSLTLSAGDLRNGTLDGAGERLISADGTYLIELAMTDVELHGTTSLYSNVVLAGSVTNAGTLRNQPGVTPHVRVTGHLLNTGIVTQASTGILSLDLEGDLTNHGIWDTYVTYVVGLEDQTIYASDDYPVGATLQLVSHLGGTGHYWTLDDVVHVGAEAPTLDLSPAVSAHHGVWQCHSSEGESRLIHIGDPAVVGAESPLLPATSALEVWPNPFQRSTEVHFRLTTASHVRLDLFDVRGRRIDRLADEVLPQGEHTLVWNAAGLSPGRYFYRLVAGQDSKTGSVVQIP